MSLLNYTLKRLIQLIPVLIGVSLIIFFSLRLVPGDPAQLLVGDDGSYEAVQQLRARYGLDQPIPVQYLTYVKNLIQGDWGSSLRSKQPVRTEIINRMGPTYALAVGGMVLAILIGVPAGVIAAAFRGRPFDRISMLVAMIGICAPTFVIGLLLQYLFSVQLRWLPTAGFDTWRHYILPIVTVSTFSIASIARLTRAGVVDVLSLDYVRTAWAKGASPSQVLFGHALKNALIPVVTVIALNFGRNLVGSVMTEIVFAVPGMGRYLIQAIGNRDYTVVQGITLVIAVTYMAVNLMADLLYAKLDPRIVYK